jgi:hypothetical protein
MMVYSLPSSYSSACCFWDTTILQLAPKPDEHSTGELKATQARLKALQQLGYEGYPQEWQGPEAQTAQLRCNCSLTAVQTIPENS